MNIRWAPAAADDLEEIGAYLKEHEAALAESTVRNLYDTVQSLRQFPRRGRLGKKSETRELLTTPLPYLIIYEIQGDTIHILRIAHGARNWPTR